MKIVFLFYKSKRQLLIKKIISIRKKEDKSLIRLRGYLQTAVYNP